MAGGRVARQSSGKRRRPPAPPIPAGRIPRRRSLTDAVTIAVDTRERYPYRFAQQGAETVRATVPAGDYADQAANGAVLAAVERKSLDNLAATLSDGTLAFQLQRLSELPLAAVVVESRYSALYKLEHVNGNWLADQLAGSRSATPNSTSSSPTPAASPKTGPTASSPPHSPTHPTRVRIAEARPTFAGSAVHHPKPGTQQSFRPLHAFVSRPVSDRDRHPGGWRT